MKLKYSLIQLIHTYGVIKAIHASIGIIINITLYFRYKKIPVSSNTILFQSDPDFFDNARAIYDYLIKTNLDKKYQLIWVISSWSKYNELRKKGIKCVPLHSIFPHGGMHRFYYYALSAKWYFFTHSTGTRHPFKKEQHIINLTHGGMGFKREIEFRSDNAEKIRTSNTVYLTLGNGDIIYEYNRIRRSCDNEKLIPLGMPRNDLLHSYKSIPLIDQYNGKKIIWSPTFRQSFLSEISSNTLISETSLPALYTKNEMQRMNKILKENNVHLFISEHPLQKKGTRMQTNESNIHSLPSNIEMDDMGIQFYETLNHFDAMISDYSSITFDYLCLNRPIGYTLDDFDAYAQKRGFAFDNPLEYMPGHHIHAFDDFVNFIKDIVNNNDPYKEERNECIKKLKITDDGKCCQHIVEYFGIN